jgi:hypothetical protein
MSYQNDIYLNWVFPSIVVTLFLPAVGRYTGVGKTKAIQSGNYYLWRI